MAEISASAVKELREITGAGMLDCKNALKETAGDIEKAITYLREKGVVKAAKKAERTAAEGLVFMNAHKHSVSLAEVNCETDFVARNEAFKELTQHIAQLANANCPNHGVSVDGDAIAQWKFSATQTVAEAVQGKIAEIGENIRARRAICLNKGNVFGGYIHSNGAIGVAVSLEATPASSADLTSLAKDIAMHIAAASPLGISRDDIPAATVQAERDIFMHQVLEEGKPAAIAEKIVTGKVNKFFAESCLLEQNYVKDPDLTITQLLAKVGKEAGCSISVTGFARFKVGEGIEKVHTDFAAEVASLAR